LDGSRLVVSNDGWEHALTDLCTIHDYRDAGTLSFTHSARESSVVAEPHERPIYVPGHGHRGEPILITEFGGIAFGTAEPEEWGYRTVASGEEFLGRYKDLIIAVVRCDVVHGFCYTQLTDVEQEVNGLLTYDRRAKVDLARVREITAVERPPAGKDA